MAILKNIPVHGDDGVQACVDYIDDSAKNTIEEALAEYDLDGEGNPDVDAVLEYAKNLEKTILDLDGEESILVSGINCYAKTAPTEFSECKHEYERRLGGNKGRGSAETATYVDRKTGEIVTKEKKSIDAEHFIQSFPGEEHGVTNLDPRLVHKIGVEYAQKAFPGHKVVVSTHMNTKHVHNHIVVCAYAMDKQKKLCMNTALRHQLRELNDEISISYGLPVLLDIDYDHKNYKKPSLNFKEKKVRSRSESGMSNKDIVRRDIDTALLLCQQRGITNWDGFVKIMEEEFKNPEKHQRGYEIKQTAKHVYFINHDIHVKGSSLAFKVRDTVLGDEYLRRGICERMGWELFKGIDDQGNAISEEQIFDSEKQAKQEEARNKIDYVKPSKSSKRPLLHISRYDENGRRRSDIELIFLAAIKLLKFFKDKLFGTGRKDIEDENVVDPINFNFDKKIRMMERSMYAANIMGLGSAKELSDRKRELGAKVNTTKNNIETLKKSVKHYQDIEDIIMDFRDTTRRLKDTEMEMIDKLLVIPDASIIRREKAELEPMTGKQKSELYLALQENEYKWKLTVQYEELTFTEADEIIKFLKKKRENKPDLLISYDEFEKNREKNRLEKLFERRDKGLKEKHGNVKISIGLIKKLKSMITEEGLTIDLEKLTMYDGIQLINHFSKNTLVGELVSDTERQELEKQLSEKGQKLNRSGQYILKSELTQIREYLTNPKKSMPNLLKESEKPKASTIKDIESLLELHGEKTDVPISEMSSLDADELLRHLLYKDHTPEILKTHTEYKKEIKPASEEQRNAAFNKLLLTVDMEHAQLYIRYRELKQKMLNIGLSEEKFDDCLKELDALEEILKIESLEYKGIANEYKNVASLERNIQFANNPKFVRGPYFDKEKKPEVSVEETKEVQKEDAEIEKDAQEHNRNIDRNDLFGEDIQH